MRLTLLLLVVSSLAMGCWASTPRSQALITSLPGQNFVPNFKQYSGYITVDPTNGRNLFYWFLESQGNPAADPVVLWLNGGPGCSSIGAGALEENGAYRPLLLDPQNKSVGLESNFWSWNKLANVIYLDSPAGVGYSYSDTPSDYNTGDNKTAVDSTTFLLLFFQMYPEFSQNAFWITGESYAGVYITGLAYNILTNSNSPTLISNLKRGGLMLGNPVTGSCSGFFCCEGPQFNGQDGELDTNTNLYNFYWHGMVSPRIYTLWNAHGCDQANPPSIALCTRLFAQAREGTGSFNQPLKLSSTTSVFDSSPAATSSVLTDATSEATDPLLQRGHINRDCLYYSYCVGNATLEFMEDYAPNCFSIEQMIATYLNYPAVQTAFHAKPTKWTACSNLNYTRTVTSVLPYLTQMFSLAPTMRILYYSGDIDIATVPFPGTFRCLEALNRPIVDPWRPWGFNNEIAGYVEVYDTYTLATLKGAGHEAPAYQPASAYNMFEAFLLNKPFPKA